VGSRGPLRPPLDDAEPLSGDRQSHTVSISATGWMFIERSTVGPELTKACGTFAGATTISPARASIVCGFAKTTVGAIVKQQLPNSSTPVRAKAPSGWICLAQEVVSRVAVAGHCQRGRSSVLSWVGVGLIAFARVHAACRSAEYLHLKEVFRSVCHGNKKAPSCSGFIGVERAL
jgi:hypothetical protein